MNNSRISYVGSLLDAAVGPVAESMVSASIKAAHVRDQRIASRQAELLELASLRAYKTTLEQNLDDSRAHNAQLQKLDQQRLTNIEEKQRQLDEYFKQLSVLRTAEKDLKQRLTDSEAHTTQLQSEIVGWKSRCSQHEATIVAQNAKIAELSRSTWSKLWQRVANWFK